MGDAGARMPAVRKTGRIIRLGELVPLATFGVGVVICSVGLMVKKVIQKEIIKRSCWIESFSLQSSCPVILVLRLLVIDLVFLGSSSLSDAEHVGDGVEEVVEAVPAGVVIGHLLEVGVESAGEGALVPEVVGHGHAEEALVAEHPPLEAGVVVEEQLVDEAEEEGLVLLVGLLQLGVLLEG